MDIKVEGGQILSGEIFPSGSKNSAVHILPATLLFDEEIILENIPDITDVDRLVKILRKLGSRVDWDKDKKKLLVDNSSIGFRRLTRNDLGNMRGTSLLWGGLLSRFKKIDFNELPGGCTLGIRPLEPIYKSFRDMGVKIKESAGGVLMDASRAGSREVWLTEMSPSVTTNLVMLAVSLPGVTKLVGVSSEPQVQDMCRFLTKGGAKIGGIGSSVLLIEGGKSLSGVTHKLLTDHYEIATFLAIGACTGGEIKIHHALPDYFHQINYEFAKFNVKIEYEEDTAIVRKGQDVRFTGSFEKKTNIIRAQPWPALPVDLIPIFIPLALAAPEGHMIFHNWMYEAGLFWTSELNKLGAEVIMGDPHRIIVMGGRKLVGCTMEAPYIIRAVVAMVMAAMQAKGETKILNADSLYRGHPCFSKNLKRLGAKIEEIK